MNSLQINWTFGPDLPEFYTTNDIHIWCLMLPKANNNVHDLYQNLSSDEINRASRFHFEKDKVGFSIARRGLRNILARYLHMPAKEIQFEYSEYGKPYLKNADIHFNISHSNEYVLYAFSKNRRLGIDVEFCKPNIDFLSLSKEICTEKEYHLLSSFSSDEQMHAFYQYWTYKEAIVKALGLGLSFPIKQIEIELNKIENDRPVVAGDLHWSIREIPIGNNYAAALAVEVMKEDEDISFWTWNETTPKINE